MSSSFLPACPWDMEIMVVSARGTHCPPSSGARAIIIYKHVGVGADS